LVDGDSGLLTAVVVTALLAIFLLVTGADGPYRHRRSTLPHPQ
jgi:hypothetical protein